MIRREGRCLKRGTIRVAGWEVYRLVEDVWEGTDMERIDTVKRLEGDLIFMSRQPLQT